MKNAKILDTMYLWNQICLKNQQNETVTVTMKQLLEMHGIT